MKILYTIEYDTETGHYNLLDYASTGNAISVVHSGSSYLRIIEDEKQVGTIAPIRPIGYNDDEMCCVIAYQKKK